MRRIGPRLARRSSSTTRLIALRRRRRGRAGHRHRRRHRIDRLRPQRAGRGRARRRLGPHDRRRGQRLLDRPAGAAPPSCARSTAAARRRADRATCSRISASADASLASCAIVYNREVPRANVATLGPIVQQRARRRRRGGDADPRAAPRRSWSLAAASVAARLEMRGDAFPFVLAGGTFRVVPWLAAELRRRLRRGGAACRVRGRSRASRRSGRRRLWRWRSCAAARNLPRYDRLSRVADRAHLSDARIPPRERSAAERRRARCEHTRARARAADRPDADPVLRELARAAPREARRLLARDDVQPRRVPRHRRRRIRAAIARSCSGTCSIT